MVAEIARRVLEYGLPPGVLLNVNFPSLPHDQIKGLQLTRLGRRVYRDVLIERLDPKGRPYYWIGGDPPAGEPEAGTDVGALAQGYVSVTPLNMDMTDREPTGRPGRLGIAVTIAGGVCSMPTQAYFQGQFVPIGEAKVSIMNHALNYGTGCFEGIRAYWNADHAQLYIFRNLEHYQRLHALDQDLTDQAAIHGAAIGRPDRRAAAPRVLS